MSIPEAFHAAILHHKNGRMKEAEVIYRQILAAQPHHADALHMLGLIASQVGRNDVAVDLIRKAISFAPNRTEFHYNLGNALGELGWLDGAVAAYRRILELRPDMAQAHGNLGKVLRQLGHSDEAVAAFRRALELKPDYALARNNLGVALRDKGRLEEAAAEFRRALYFQPGDADTHKNLANVLREQGCLDEAIAEFRRALQLMANDAGAHYGLGTALLDRGEIDQAVSEFRRALQLKPDFAEAHTDLGTGLREQGHLEEAVAEYRRALELKPNYPLAHNNLGTALADRGHLQEAVAAFRRALELKPDYATAYKNLGFALQNQGYLDDAIIAYRRALQLQPGFADAHTCLLYCLHYLPDSDPNEIFREHCGWQELHGRPLEKFRQPHSNLPDPARRLRVGYVSADFRKHSVAFFLESLFAAHDREKVELFCYADVLREDAFTERFRQYAAQWRSITGMGDEQVANLIRTDSIDILVDLAGHTAHNRLRVFARKPAPVQVSYLGYPNTTGLSAMDYRVTDADADPPGSMDHLHTEQLVRLPDSAWCFRPFDESPPVAERPAVSTGGIVFGCFNARPKITEELVTLWARLLRQVPGSRLLLKIAGVSEPTAQDRMRELLAKGGVERERLELMGRTPTTSEHLAVYGRVDIALDTFPYHGTTTTCEALWMGVPVVTLAGKTHASRVGVSLLHNIGLEDLIAHSREQYVEIAVKLAGDVARLAQLRATLRTRMAASPLMNAPQFARNMEGAYRRMWSEWCRK